MFGLIDYIRNAFRYGNTLVQLVVINVVVYLVLISVGLGFWIAGNPFPQGYEFLSNWFKLKASFYEFLRQPWGLITYAFTHGVNPFHLVFNMLFFYWMGYIVQEYIGSRKLLNIYLIGAIFSGLVYITCFAIFKTIGVHAVIIDEYLIGASAATFAVAFAAMRI
jgi:membrane associated rhomboid family serine protease